MAVVLGLIIGGNRCVCQAGHSGRLATLSADYGGEGHRRTAEAARAYFERSFSDRVFVISDFSPTC